MDEYFVSHELMTCVQGPEHYWMALIAATKEVFSGKIAVALNWGPFTSHSPQIIPQWLGGLDFLGLDCYYNNPAAIALPPSLPWELPTREQLLAGWETIPSVGPLGWVKAIANYSKALGDISIVCTEVGYQSVLPPVTHRNGKHHAYCWAAADCCAAAGRSRSHGSTRQARPASTRGTVPYSRSAFRLRLRRLASRSSSRPSIHSHGSEDSTCGSGARTPVLEGHRTIPSAVPASLRRKLC